MTEWTGDKAKKRPEEDDRIPRDFPAMVSIGERQYWLREIRRERGKVILTYEEAAD